MGARAGPALWLRYGTVDPHDLVTEVWQILDRFPRRVIDAQAIFDPDRTATDADHPVFAVVAVVGFLFGAFLIPLGMTAVPAVVLMHGHRLVVAILATVAAVNAIALVQTAAERGLTKLDGDQLRLQTEGILGLLGTASLVGGISVLHHVRRREAARAPLLIADGTRT